ncbi:MAG: NlpC/P60 family protein [Actinomycetota bacterium]
MNPHPRRALTRGSIAVALMLLPVLVAGPASIARPSHADLEAARERLHAAIERLDILVEEYDATQVSVDELSAQLAELRGVRDRSQARADEATARLEGVAAEAYKNPNSEIEVLLSSTSLTELTNRIQFLDTLSQIHEDTATTAAVNSEQARRAGVRVEKALSEQRRLLDSLEEQKSGIEGRVADLDSQIDRLEEALRQPVLVPIAATSAPAPAPVDTGPVGLPPPVSGEGAAAAIAAAESVIGTPYQYAGASPEGGFDCSGLTMWAWAHGGVSLPHSSAAQYEALPHIDQSQLQPGDLVFFYNPIHHVGLYVGGGQMIDAPHTGTVVQRRAVEWSVYTGAARPG